MISNLKNVPPNWQKVRFDEIAEIVTDRIEKPTESGLSDYIGLEHLDTDCIRIKRFGSTEDVDATKFLCKKGDIIFGKRRAYLRKLAVSDREAVVSAHSMVLRPTGDKIYPDFLPCFMQSSIFWKTAHSISEGSMSPTIKWKTLAAQEFWLPSIDDQKKISELLWSIEDNIQKTEKLIETTEKLKQGLLNELLTKGIGHTQFKGTEMGKIPERWKIVTLDEIADVIDPHPSHRAPKIVQNGYPFAGIGDILEDGTILVENCRKVSGNAIKDQEKSFLIEDYDIGFGRVGTVGKVVWLKKQEYKYALSPTLSLIKPKYASRSFVFYALNSKLIEQQVNNLITGSTRPSLGIMKLRKIYILLPPEDEQQKIVYVLSSQEKNVLRLKDHMNNLSNVKKKISNKLLTEMLKV